MRKPTKLIKPGKHRPAAVHEEVFKLKDSHKIFLLRRNISQLRILVYNTSHNHRKYCKKTTKNSYSKISKLMITLRLRERLGRCCGKLNHGDCSGTLSLLLPVSTQLRKRLGQTSSLQTVPRSGNQNKTDSVSSAQSNVH